MATKVIQLTTCDACGDETTADRSFNITDSGVTYAVDLCEKHAKPITEAIASGKRVGGRLKGVKTGSGRTSEELNAVRDWARQNGHLVADRGRVAEYVLTAYDEAQKAPKGRKAPLKAVKSDADDTDAAVSV